MKKVNISHVNNMHSQWLRTLNFYKTELAVLKGILTEIAGKYTKGELLKEVEHFENQFKVHTNSIDVMSHDIHVNVARMATQAQHQPASYIDGILSEEHTLLGAQVAGEEKAVSETIHAFREFAAKWM